jgi:sodium/proline symporter
MLGGFWAVSVTDTLQGTLMATAAILLPLAGLVAVGGPFELVERLSHAEAGAYLDPGRGMAWFPAAGFIVGLLGIGLGYPGQPHVVNRFMALTDRPGAVRDARRLAIGWALIVYSGMLLLGFCGRVLSPGLADPELVFIRLSNDLFPPMVSGILLAAVLSAIMSTVDSQLLVASSTVSHDLGLGAGLRWSPLARSRVVVLALSAAAVAAALVGPQEIFSRVLFAWAAMGSAFGPLLLTLSFGRRVPPSRRLWSIAAGFVLSVAAYYLIPDGHPWKGCWERVIPFLAAGLIALSPRLRTRTPVNSSV